MRFENFYQYINEEFVGFMQDRSNKTIEVYKNPKSIKRMESDIRAVAYKNGDLYIVDDSYDLLHKDIVQYLEKNTKEPIFYTRTAYIEHQVHLRRFKDTNYFYLGEGYIVLDVEVEYEFFTEILQKCKKKNPRYNFIMQIYTEAINPKEDIKNHEVI